MKVVISIIASALLYAALIARLDYTPPIHLLTAPTFEWTRYAGLKYRVLPLNPKVDKYAMPDERREVRRN